MHELSIAQALVEQLEKIVREQKATRVLRVELAVGGLAGVDPEALRTAFPLAAEGTRAEGAALAIEHVAPAVVCRQCASRSASGSFPCICEHCGSADVEIDAGRELLIRAVEIEQPDPVA